MIIYLVSESFLIFKNLLSPREPRVTISRGFGPKAMHCIVPNPLFFWVVVCSKRPVSICRPRVMAKSQMDEFFLSISCLILLFLTYRYRDFLETLDNFAAHKTRYIRSRWENGGGGYPRLLNSDTLSFTKEYAEK